MYKNMLPELKALADKDPEAQKNYKKSWDERRKNASMTAVVRISAGVIMYEIARALADEDDEVPPRNKVATDDKAQWTRNARLPVNWILNMLGDSPTENIIKARFKDKFVNIPWGFGFGAFDAFGAQLAAVMHGDTEARDFLFNTGLIAADSFMPLPVSRINPWEHENGPVAGMAFWAVDSTLMSVSRPAFEYLANVNGLGRSIFNENVNKYGPSYQDADKVPQGYSDFTKWFNDTFDAQLQPQELAFLVSSYGDGMGELASWSYDLGSLYQTDRPFNPKSDTIVLNRFIGSPSRIDPKEFYKANQESQKFIQKLNEYKNTDSIKYNTYVYTHPEALYFEFLYNTATNGPLKDVQEQINFARANQEYSPNTRELELARLYKERDHLMYLTVQQYKAIKDLNLKP
jgi:hypothetical protein